MKPQAALSHELQILRRQFKPFEKTGLSLSSEEVVRLSKRISLLSKLSRTYETELSIYRLVDAGKLKADAIEEAAIEASGNLILSTEGNVVRPDFTKGGR